MANEQPLTDLRVLMLVGDMYEDLELWYPKLRLEEAGCDVTLVTLPGGTHGTPLFFDPSQNPWAQLSSDDPGGQATVAAILAAIESAQS